MGRQDGKPHGGRQEDQGRRIRYGEAGRGVRRVRQVVRLRQRRLLAQGPAEQGLFLHGLDPGRVRRDGRHGHRHGGHRGRRRRSRRFVRRRRERHLQRRADPVRPHGGRRLGLGGPLQVLLCDLHHRRRRQPDDGVRSVRHPQLLPEGRREQPRGGVLHDRLEVGDEEAHRRQLLSQGDAQRRVQVPRPHPEGHRREATRPRGRHGQRRADIRRLVGPALCEGLQLHQDAERRDGHCPGLEGHVPLRGLRRHQGGLQPQRAVHLLVQEGPGACDRLAQGRHPQPGERLVAPVRPRQDLRRRELLRQHHRREPLRDLARQGRPRGLRHRRRVRRDVRDDRVQPVRQDHRQEHHRRQRQLRHARGDPGRRGGQVLRRRVRHDARRGRQAARRGDAPDPHRVLRGRQVRPGRRGRPRGRRVLGRYRARPRAAILRTGRPCRRLPERGTRVQRRRLARLVQGRLPRRADLPVQGGVRQRRDDRHRPRLRDMHAQLQGRPREGHVRVRHEDVRRGRYARRRRDAQRDEERDVLHQGVPRAHRRHERRRDVRPGLPGLQGPLGRHEGQGVQRRDRRGHRPGYGREGHQRGRHRARQTRREVDRRGRHIFAGHRDDDVPDRHLP